MRDLFGTSMMQMSWKRPESETGKMELRKVKLESSFGLGFEGVLLRYHIRIDLGKCLWVAGLVH